MEFTLRVWRQAGPTAQGRLETYRATDIDSDMSILEMLDKVNLDLIKEGIEPIAFESDCREGICGMCGLAIDGVPHGKEKGTTTCELRMRHFTEGQTITIEPFRAGCFPVIKDLIVDRTVMDRIIQAGGYVSVRSGSQPDANTIPVAKKDQEESMDAAECIGCGACAAACPNGSLMLFVGSKVSHLVKMPQGQLEAARRVKNMTRVMRQEGSGNCSNHYECQAVCPKEIDVKFIARLNREFLKALPKEADEG